MVQVRTGGRQGGTGADQCLGEKNYTEDSGFWLSNWMQRECIAIHRAGDAVPRGDLEFLEELSQRCLCGIHVEVPSGQWLVQNPEGPPWRLGVPWLPGPGLRSISAFQTVIGARREAQWSGVSQRLATVLQPAWSLSAAR